MIVIVVNLSIVHSALLVIFWVWGLCVLGLGRLFSFSGSSHGPCPGLEWALGLSKNYHSNYLDNSWYVAWWDHCSYNFVPQDGWRLAVCAPRALGYYDDCKISEVSRSCIEIMLPMRRWSHCLSFPFPNALATVTFFYKFIPFFFFTFSSPYTFFLFPSSLPFHSLMFYFFFNR